MDVTAAEEEAKSAKEMEAGRCQDEKRPWPRGKMVLRLMEGPGETGRGERKPWTMEKEPWTP